VGRKDLIDRARRVRKMLGGTMRQVGILAAAGLYALEHNVDRLSEDHANAERLAKGLAGLGLKVDPVQSNMVFASIPKESVAGLKAHLEKSGVVALWNSDTWQPGGLEFEVMDMIYHLPFRDWLELNKNASQSIAAADSEPDSGGPS